MVIRVKVAPVEKWCARRIDDGPMPETIEIFSGSMRQTIASDEDDLDTQLPEKTRCGGRMWRLAGEENVWICEHMIEIGD